MGTPFILSYTLHVFIIIHLSTIAFSSNNENRGVIFIIIFVIVWIGSFIIALNTHFLGGNP